MGGAHETQALPFVPQAMAVAPGRQVEPAQHPIGQVVASQTQAPPAQRCPPAQAGPGPQAQVPEDAQLSATVGLHIAHEAPTGPQAETERTTQVAPTQQPFGQLIGLQPAATQVPPEQMEPGAQAGFGPQAQPPIGLQWSAAVGSHAAHAAPAGAQAVTERTTHVAPAQQPVGQLVASQLLAHVPPEQDWLAAHC